LPIALRAFYDVVGSVNFVGKIASGWPDECTLDPLQVLAFSPQVEGLVRGEWDTVEIAEDPCHKYLYSGLDSLVVSVPGFSIRCCNSTEMIWNFSGGL
jgi:hypothetical protein